MITIDKAINEITFYATLKESTTTTNPIYRLVLFNFFTNVTYEFPITLTYSSDRYDILTTHRTDEINSKVIETGEYKYIIRELLSGNVNDAYVATNWNVVEKGLVKVYDTDSVETTYQITPDEEDDDYITYNG